MNRREIFRVAGAAAVAGVAYPAGVLAQDPAAALQEGAFYPLSDRVREDFEALLARQESKATVLGFAEAARDPIDTLDRYLMWSIYAMDATATDHVPTSPDIPEPPQRFGNQLGPHRSARAMAIVHVAMFEAMNAINPRYSSYIGLSPVSVPVSMDAALAWAAHDALIALYPFQQQRISALLTSDLIRIPGYGTDSVLAARSRDLGKSAAAKIVGLRANDNSAHREPEVGVDFTPLGTPGAWAIDPVFPTTVALGARWHEVTPFVLTAADQFRPLPPPTLDSPEYAAAYNEVKRLGGDPARGTATERRDFETFEGLFWAFDGTPGLCAPPRLYNKIAHDVAIQKGMRDPLDMARMLAVLNVAMADAAISAWEAKWHYQFWRPITAIHQADVSTNPGTIADPAFIPLGAPATNGRGPNFTPPFPAYPSGHAVFGGAMAQVLRNYYPDEANQYFTFVSDEYNGLNLGVSDSAPRPRMPQSFVSFAHAEYVNARSRIFLGIHFNFDASSGIEQGKQVGQFVFDNVFRPV